MENDKLQDLVLEALEKLVQNNNEIRQTTNKLNQRIDGIESAIIRIENDLSEKLRALLDTQQVQIQINQRILDALTQSEGKEETPSKGLFS